MVFLLALVFTTVSAGAAQTPILELENQIQQRVISIVQRADSLAIVQVQIKPRKVSADLPVFGLFAQVTPMSFEGQLSSATVESINIRVISQLDNIPEWIKSEIKRTIEVSNVKVDISYEKAAGQLTDDRQELARALKDSVEVAMNGLNQMKQGVWGIIAAITLSLMALAWAVISLARRMETSLGRVVDEKVVPAMQSNSSGGSRPLEKSDRAETSRLPAPIVSNNGGKELSEFLPETLNALFTDCYWTQSDGYANFLWQQCTQAQKKALLESDFVEPLYFAFVRGVAPQNLEYHHDPRYLSARNDFRHMNQIDLSEWLNKNPKYFARITPLRWDMMPLSLEQRIRFSAMKPDAALEPVKLTMKSTPRELQARLEIKQLRIQDEDFIWENPEKIPATARESLRTLVWLALVSIDARRKVLADLDARQLAEAWTGPEAVLAKLKEALPSKKLEMLEHFLKSSTPGRDSDSFAYLVEAGLRLYEVQSSTQAEAA